MRSYRQSFFLNLTAYLTVAGAAIGGVLNVERILLRWQVMILLAIFIVLQSRLPADPGTPARRRNANLIIAAQALIVAYLVTATGVGFSFLMLLFILSVNAALYNPLRYTFIWIGVFTAFTVWYLLLYKGWAGLVGEIGLYLGGFLFFGFITNALNVARQAQAENERLLVEVQAMNSQLVEYARQVETLAALEERNRLAREVHDTLGHRLTSSAVQLEAAQRLVPRDPNKAAEMVGVAREQVRAALQELRQTVGRLRAPVELELSLPQALRRLVEDFQTATGLKVSLEVPDMPFEINPAQRLVLYRAAQEGLTNIQRHAAATQAWLRLDNDPDELRLEVQDNGVGPSGAELANGGFGLRGLQERANAIGGQVSLASHSSGGSVLTVSLPVIHPEGLIQDEKPLPEGKTESNAL